MMRLFAAVVIPTDLVERRQTCSVCLVERRQTAAAAAAVVADDDDSTQLLPSSVAVEEVVEAVAVAVVEVLLLPMSLRGGGGEEDFETGSRVSSCSSSHSPTPLPSSSSFRSPPEEDTCAFEVLLTNDPAQPHLEFVDCSRSADCFPHRRRHDVLVRVLVASACRVFFSSS